MLHLIYDAIDGHATPDGKVDQLADQLVHDALSGIDREFHFSTDNLLNAVRVAVRRGQISIDQVKITCHRVVGGEVIDREVKIYPSGGLRPCPKGFCDRVEVYLSELL